MRTMWCKLLPARQPALLGSIHRRARHAFWRRGARRAWKRGERCWEDAHFQAAIEEHLAMWDIMGAWSTNLLGDGIPCSKCRQRVRGVLCYTGWHEPAHWGCAGCPQAADDPSAAHMGNQEFNKSQALTRRGETSLCSRRGDGLCAKGSTAPRACASARTRCIGTNRRQWRPYILEQAKREMHIAGLCSSASLPSWKDWPRRKHEMGCCGPPLKSCVGVGRQPAQVIKPGVVVQQLPMVMQNSAACARAVLVGTVSWSVCRQELGKGLLIALLVWECAHLNGLAILAMFFVILGVHCEHHSCCQSLTTALFALVQPAWGSWLRALACVLALAYPIFGRTDSDNTQELHLMSGTAFASMHTGNHGQQEADHIIAAYEDYNAGLLDHDQVVNLIEELAANFINMRYEDDWSEEESANMPSSHTNDHGQDHTCHEPLQNNCDTALQACAPRTTSMQSA